MDEHWVGKVQVYLTRTNRVAVYPDCIKISDDAHEPQIYDSNKQIRLNMSGVLNFVKEKVKDLDFNFIKHRDKKWGYHRLNEKETYELLRDEGI